MSTKTDFYLGRGPDAEWVGSLQWDCDPGTLPRVPPGRRALTASDEPTYRAAVQDVPTAWAITEPADTDRRDHNGHRRRHIRPAHG